MSSRFNPSRQTPTGHNPSHFPFTMTPLADLLYRVPLLHRNGPVDIRVGNIVHDSRRVQPGDVFVAVRGTQVNGADYIPQAVASGAAVVVAEQLPADQMPNVAYLQVANAAIALGELAANYHGRPSEELRVVGVTGTNGKTSVTTLLHQLFTLLGETAGLVGTVEARIGTETLPGGLTTPNAPDLQALFARMASTGCRTAFVEVSSIAQHQHRLAGTRFAGGVFTNLTHDHLDYHGSFAAYRDAKKSFFDGLPGDAFALTNADDRNGAVMLQNTTARKRDFGLKNLADYKGRVLEKTFEGMLVEFGGPGLAETQWYTQLTGTFNAYNLLAVFAVATELGLEPEAFLPALSQVRPARGRFQVVPLPRQIVGIVDYAHTPDALQNVLETIRDIHGRAGRILTVVGAGGDRDPAKRPEMGRIAAMLSDQVLLTSDNPRTEDPLAILSNLQAGVPAERSGRVLTLPDRREAIRAAAQLAQPGDVVLVAGKGHETYQEVNGVRRPFDDAHELAEAFSHQTNPRGNR